MTTHPTANWPRRVTLGIALLTGLGLLLGGASCGLVFWYQTAIYPDANHITSSSTTNGIKQIYAGSYRWSASNVTYFMSDDTPDKIIKWYGPRYKSQNYKMGPVSITVSSNEVHYSPPVLYRISTDVTVSFESSH